MYLNFFKMNKEPFSVTPDPEFLFLSPSHKEALAAVIYGVEQKKGFVAIIGEVGVGKTTIIRSYLDRVDRNRLKPIYLFNANVNFAGLLKSIFRELGVDSSSDTLYEMVTRLHEYLISEYAQGRTIVLIIDEAQNMPVETLENLRMLSNLETTKDKLIQIVFSAQPEFEELLARRELRQLRQRIAVKAMIRPLSSDESFSYIRHRLAKAAAGDDRIFTVCAMRLIVRHAKGIPRVINMLCDNSLITSYGYKRKNVNYRLVREIIADFDAKGKRTFRWSNVVAASLLGIIVCTGIYMTLGPLSSRMPPATGSVSASSGGSLQSRDSDGTESPVLAVDQGHVQAGSGVTSAEPADKPAMVSRLVKKGDTLAGLIVDTYGYVNRAVFELVKKNNPGIKDADRIVEGERVFFPVGNK